MSEKIEAKIKKLFKLAASSNEHEAQLAMERAAELMEQYSISKDDLDESPFAGETTSENIWQLTKERFNGPLVYAIGQAFGGECIGLSGAAKFDVIGSQAVIATIKGMYEFALSTIDRLTHHHMKHPELPPYASKGERVKYKNRYRSGLASGMMETLDKIAKQNKGETAKKSEYGLVLLTNSEKVQRFTKEKYPRLVTSRTKTLSGAGFSNGKADGRNVGFSGQVGRGGSQKLIG